MAEQIILIGEKENSEPEVTSGKEEMTAAAVHRYEKRVRQYQTLLLRLGMLLAAIWVLFFLVIGLLRAPNGDMHPRIDAGDMVLFYRLDKDVRAHDVIVLVTEINGEKETTLGRVIAASGDTVEITEDGKVIVNGNVQIENDIYRKTRPYENSSVTYPITLGKDEAFVLADSREGGMDSRYFGPVRKSEIAGTVISLWRKVNL